MGSADGDDDEEPVRTVRVGDFWMMETEVTVGMFRRFVDATRHRTSAETTGGGYVYEDGSWGQRADADWENPYFRQTDDHPVVIVSWYDAVAYANWLSEQDGLSPAYRISGTNVSWNRSANGWRLPTEAEWEYAARGGQEARDTTYAGSDSVDRVAWYGGNSNGRTQPVGGKQANELGLHDMSGNVWEWCWDWYDGDYYGSGPTSDPAGPSSGSCRVFRGGSWGIFASGTRVAIRGNVAPSGSIDNVGFRLVRSPVQ